MPQDMEDLVGNVGDDIKIKIYKSIFVQCVELEYQDVDHTHSSTSHVVAIALQAMKAPHACATI